MLMNERLSVYLHQMRWIAALAVVIGHARALMFVDYAQLASSSFLLRIIYFVTGFGHQAVIIFFVISGYLIGGKCVQLFKENKFSTKKYLIDRISRIYTVLILALIMGYILDSLGLTHFNRTGLYTNPEQYGLNLFSSGSPSQLLTPINLASNFFMFQDIFTPTLGSNGPLWSLSYEFWYYLLFPAVLFLVWNGKNKRIRIVSALIVICIVIILPRIILLNFLIWLMGTSLALIKRSIFKRIFLPLTLLLCTLVAIRYGLINSQISDFVLGLVFALNVNTVMHNSDGRPVNPLWKTFHTTMSGFSYSIYAMHFPMLLLVIAVLSSSFGVGLRQQPTLGVFIMYFFVIVVLYAYSFLASRLTEARTSQVREFLTRRFALR